MAMAVVLASLLLFIFAKSSFAEPGYEQHKTVSGDQETSFKESRSQKISNSKHIMKYTEGGNEKTITFMNPKVLTSPVVIKLQAIQNKWVSSPSTVKVFTWIITTSLLIGNLFSIMVFRIAYRSGICKPLNLLISVDQAFKMLGNTWSISVIALSATLVWSKDKIPLANYTGEAFCNVSFLVAAITGVSNILLGE